MKWWKGTIRRLQEDMVLVVGTNPAGRHGKGAAKFAMQFGAKYGQGRGMMGQTYGLVTKNLNKDFIEQHGNREIHYDKTGPRSLSKEQVEENIFDMYTIAMTLPALRFIVIYQATDDNLNGYTAKEMWEMFTHVDPPDNIYFHVSFKKFLTE